MCSDSLALSLLYDRQFTFPPVASTKKFTPREKSSKRPTAWEKDKDGLEEAEEEATRRQHGCPITTADEMVLLTPTKKAKVISSPSSTYTYTSYTVC